MEGEGSSRRVFICYRREDSSAAAARLAQDLEVQFPNGVFTDEKLEPSSRWEEQLELEIARSHVVLVLIADRWLHLQNRRSGKRRLDEDKDVVRREIELALARKGPARILPVMVDGAQVPDPDDLPETIRELVAHHTSGLRTGSNEAWKTDVGKLVSFIRAIPVPAPVPSTIEMAAPATVASAHSQFPSLTPPGQTTAATDAGMRASRVPRRNDFTTVIAAGTVVVAALLVPRAMSLWPAVEPPPPPAEPATSELAGEAERGKDPEKPAEPATPPATTPDTPVSEAPSPTPEAKPTSVTVQNQRSTDGAAGTGAKQKDAPSRPAVEPSPVDTAQTEPPSTPDAASQPPWLVQVFHPGCDGCVWPTGTAVRLQIERENGSMTEPVDSEGKARFALTQEMATYKGRITLVDAGLCEGELRDVSLNAASQLEARRNGNVAACYGPEGKRCPCLRRDPCSKQCVTGGAP